MNELLQWAVLAVFVVLILGLFRQVSFTLPAPRRSAEEGLPVGSRLPQRLLDEMTQTTPRFKSTGATVAFISEGCVGCQRLLADIESSLQALPSTLVLVANRPSSGFLNAIDQTGATRILDSHGHYWRSCRVTATPLVVQVDPAGRVLRKEVTHDVRRVALAKR